MSLVLHRATVRCDTVRCRRPSSRIVRHAYFTGGDEPYEKLKRALRADIDERAWSTLYSTVSRPFAPPETGRIAVNVINHYGDEVYDVVAAPVATAV